MEQQPSAQSETPTVAEPQVSVNLGIQKTPATTEEFAEDNISEENKEEHHVSDSQHNEHYERIQEEQVDSYTAQSPVDV